MHDAQSRIDAWREDQTLNRPHSSLENWPPSAFAAQINPARKVASRLDQNWGQDQLRSDGLPIKAKGLTTSLRS